MSSAYNAFHENAAWFDLSERGKLRVTGEDRARLLHAMTTNHVQQLTPGQGCYAFFLNAQGRILGDVNVLAMEDALLLDTEPSARERIREHLDKYIIADDVTVEDVTPDWVTIAIEGPSARAMLHTAGAPTPEGDTFWAPWGDCIIARLSYTGEPGYWAFVPVAEREHFLGKIETGSGALAATPDEVELVRLEHGRPRYGVDFTEANIPQETQLGQALHFSKGCYLGQEIVERVRSRGHVNRLLVPLRIDTDKPPARGTKVMAAGKEVGEITSSAYSPALGKVVALAIARAEHAAPEHALEVDGAQAVVAPANS